MAAVLLCAVGAWAAPPAPTDAQQRELSQLATEHQTRMQKQDYAGATAAARQRWTLHQKIYGADSDEAETYKKSLAETLELAGQGAEALQLFHQLAATAAKNHGADSQQVFAVLQRTEGLLLKLERWDELEAVYQRVLAIKKKLDGEGSLAYVTELGSHAAFLAAQSQYAASQLAREQQVKLFAQLTAGKPDPNFAAALLALGQLYWQTQQAEKAIATFERSLAMSERVSGVPAWTRGPTIVAVAMTYRQAGRTELSLPLEKQARELYSQEIARLTKATPNDPMLSTLLGFYGQLQWWTDELAAAEQLLTRAMELDRKLGRPSTWTAVLAQLKRVLGKPQEALALLERATADSEKVSNLKNVYSSMFADLYGDLGDYKRAQTALEEYLAQLAKLRGKRSPEYGVGLLRVALNEVRRGNVADAEPRLTEGLELAERDLTTTLRSGTESDHRQWFRRNGYQLELAISYHRTHAPNSAGAARLAMTTLLRRKGRPLDVAAASLATIRAKLSPADQQLLDELASARGQLAKLKVLGPANSPDTFLKDVAALEARIQELELKLSQKSAEYRASSQPIELAAIQKLIPAHTKLVELVNHQPFDLLRRSALKPTPVAHTYLAYIIGHTGDPVQVELGPADAIDQAVAAYRKALANSASDNVNELGHALYSLTFAKLAPLLGDTKDILIAPDGTLNLVPFAALVDGRQKFLIERFTFTYLTSGRDLLRLNVKTKAQSGGVIFADPSFDASASEKTDNAANRGSRSVELSSISWPQLPGTRQEAEQVVKTMKKFKLYAGEQATEGQLKQLHGPRILHLATHGFFLRDKPRKQPSRGPDAPAGPVAPAPPEENPLLRSGLVLAGANELAAKREDGILTSLEATGLDLWGTKLVVLSACQTGDGKVTNGDGVYGLRRALVIAGAEGLVMTLWQVDDFATRDLMIGFYRLIQKGRARSSALRDMQLELLALPKYAHPYFWASFVPAGENAPIKN